MIEYDLDECCLMHRNVEQIDGTGMLVVNDASWPPESEEPFRCKQNRTRRSQNFSNGFAVPSKTITSVLLHQLIKFAIDSHRPTISERRSAHPKNEAQRPCRNPECRLWGCRVASQIIKLSVYRAHHSMPSPFFDGVVP